MTQAQPTPQGPNKEAVGRMFNEIARSYDPINTLLSFGTDRRWRRLLVRGVVKDNPRHILDLAAGTGEVTLPLAKALPESHITAADLSEGMLEVARRKFASQGLEERVGVVVADAEALPGGEEQFDCVTLVFGIRNFSAPAAAMAELFRVTKPGAKIYIMEFGIPEGAIFGALYRFYQRRVMPLVGGLLSGKWRAYRYLPTSIDAFARRVDVERLIGEAGFESVATQSLTRGIAKLYSAQKPSDIR